MKREELKALGLTDEAIESVMKIHGQDIESHKAKLTQYDEQVKTLNTSIKERDTQLEELQKSTGDIEGLKSQITSLQDTNKTQAEEYLTKMKDLQVSTALKNALAGKVHDADLVSTLVAKDKLLVQDDGTVLGLDEQITALKESKQFLFVPESTEPGTPGFQKIGNPTDPGAGGAGIDAAISAAFGNKQK